MFACRFPMGTKFITVKKMIICVESVFVTTNNKIIYALRSKNGRGKTFYWSEEHIMDRLHIGDIRILED